MDKKNKQVFCSHCNRYVDNKPETPVDKNGIAWIVCPRCGGYWRKAEEKWT